jgi:uncharacterized membrane protein HdeD (DUF308 family)
MKERKLTIWEEKKWWFVVVGAMASIGGILALASTLLNLETLSDSNIILGTLACILSGGSGIVLIVTALIEKEEKV